MITKQEALNRITNRDPQIIKLVRLLFCYLRYCSELKDFEILVYLMKLSKVFILYENKYETTKNHKWISESWIKNVTSSNCMLSRISSKITTKNQSYITWSATWCCIGVLTYSDVNVR